ncbi:MAG: hypothetical protein A2521_16475 [Deltaproteobacteria bacterium RIFOXYD12_FULL_57_12]|nr:MAG: hypothetical protein A2521_16475 [Deltaproteobacteria bacterium RIFOXYD12_FULL_57_12]
MLIFPNWFANFHFFDWLAFAFFLTGLFGYRYYLSFMLKRHSHRLFLGKLQQYRHAWINGHSGGQDRIVVVQTLRNMLMAASFMASTSILLIMGAFNLLRTLAPPEMAGNFFMTGISQQPVEVFKILLIILILSYTFFNFTWHIREVNYMSMVLNISKEQLDEIEGGDSSDHIARMFLTSGIYFSLGMRGYYFLIPLLIWFFSPVLMICATALILYVLIHRDLAA